MTDESWLIAADYSGRAARSSAQRFTLVSKAAAPQRTGLNEYRRGLTAMSYTNIQRQRLLTDRALTSFHELGDFGNRSFAL
jgi:hypothetical protein